MKIEAPVMLRKVDEVLAGFGRKDWMKGLDIKAEMEKIRTKKSTLSKNQRNWVEAMDYRQKLAQYIDGYQKTWKFRFQEIGWALSGALEKVVKFFKGKKETPL